MEAILPFIVAGDPDSAGRGLEGLPELGPLLPDLHKRAEDQRQ